MGRGRDVSPTRLVIPSIKTGAVNKVYDLINTSYKTGKIYLNKINDIRVKFIQLNLTKINIKRMASEIPTNSFINNYFIHQTSKILCEARENFFF